VRRREDLLAALTGTALVVVAIGAWHAYVTAFEVSAFILPAPAQVAEAWWALLREPAAWRHSWVTAYETLVGFVIATVLGVAFGTVLGKLRWLERALNPFIVASQVVPKIALVPLFVVWFGFGITTKVIVAAVLAFFPVFSNTLLGVKSVDPGHRDVMRSLNAGRLDGFLRLELPSALPYILTGMEVGVVLALIGAVVGEYLGGNEGLGYLAVASMNAYDTARLFAVILQLSLLGLVLYAAVGALRRLVIPWHESAAPRL